VKGVFHITIEDDIISMHVKDATSTISGLDYGTHALVVYEDLEKLIVVFNFSDRQFKKNTPWDEFLQSRWC
jgi:hypothetical protein